MTSIIDTLAAIMGVVMSLGYYPQAWRIYKNKSAANISRTSYVIFATGTTTWFVYGLVHQDITVISGFVLGVIGSWLTLILISVYGKSVAQ